MKKKRLLYIGNNLISKTGYPTTIDTLSSLFEKEGYIVFKSSNKKNKVLRLLDMFWSVLKNVFKIDYILIDTYSTSNFYYAFFISQLARLLNKKYIIILHGGNLPFRLEKSKWFSNLIFFNSYKNIAPSAYLKTEFEKKDYVVDYIPNVISIKNYSFKERKIEEPKLLFVRAFASIYNPKMAIDVLYYLKKEYPKSKLCMIGPDRDGSKSEIEKYIKEMGLESNVEITGVLSKKEWHSKSSFFNIFINTTNFDNTPVSVIEGMALGLPVVSTNVGGIPYLIKNNHDGLLVEKKDSLAMVEKIKFLINNPKIVEDLTINARGKVEKYDWEIVKHSWKKILK